MRGDGTGLHMFLMLLLHVTHQVGVAEVALDNIAMPQEESRAYVLPAPGLRHRPGTQQDQQQQLQDNFQLLQSPSGMTRNPETKGHRGMKVGRVKGSNEGVVGNLLPLEPGVAMAQVVALDVACQRDQMNVRIIFDRSFDGIMYAKGFYSSPQCTYVAHGTGGQEFEFLMVAGTCGTQYVEAQGGPSYLENIVVIQNEPGIQEIWDTARGVRCVFDGAGGDSTHRVSAALNVAMLDQQVVSFSADTIASASLDIQIGRGPFAPSASGMVKIGELMTMVVGVEGPANADLLVRECVAHDGSHQNPYQLTDENGCVLGSRKKLLGSWQKTRDTGNPQVSVISYSHFQGGRKKRSLPVSSHRGDDSRRQDESEDEGEEGAGGLGSSRSNRINNKRGSKNESVTEPVRLARRLRVISPEDYSLIRDTPITLVTKEAEAGNGDMCMSVSAFVAGLVVMFVVLVLSSVVTALLCIRIRTIPSASSTYPPDTSFHAFSTVSGKTF
ncbi:putative Zona pellucida-like domain-containing protein 5 [Homarus americanus]|uniref:Putative Zona pellucida-like domain-containing protein 5 n=1 Tax=Homarus americanus TaxID=6706 RepID=A0A8J5JRL5_HOMAM|nr:putative Zona pellucida-like domain-containing protein 5 [Homarus americanus]